MTDHKRDEPDVLLLPDRPNYRRPIIAGVALLAAVVTVAILGPSEVGEQFLYLLEEDRSGTSMVVFTLFYLVAPVFFIPAILLAIGAGFLFGGLWGGIIALSCRPLGALVTFLVSRYIARDLVHRRVAGWKSFRAIDGLTSEKPWRVVFLMRLFPVIPFNLANYIFGLTRVDWKRYTAATALGVGPGTAVYVYLGMIASDLTRALALEEATGISPAHYFALLGGFLLIGLLAWLAHWGRKKWIATIEQSAPDEGA